jgi:hypothetical protein
MKLHLRKAQEFPKWFSKNDLIFYMFLFIQNIAIFWQHYFNNVGFPWDFPTTYYAWPAFWTTSISMGIFPQWIPYQAMGYPFAINAQAGFYYPIFWIFALLHIPYTLHAAVIVQIFHVLFGSIGMFLLLKLIFKSSRYAFIGAAAFQFFGGFYSNAEHSDIIRAFAIAPWLFYVFKINLDKPSITRRILFIPIVIYFLATGAYPGNFISSIFILSIFLCLETFQAYLKVKHRALKVGVAAAGLMILGLSMALVHLGPIWQEKNELTRFTNYASQLHAGLGIQDIPALFMSSSSIVGEPSMISTFVTLPMLVFASFIPIMAIKKHWVFVVVLILSVLMVAGPNSPFWQTITSAVPALKLSRFPSSDYRVVVAIPIVILGTAGLKAIIECGLSWKEFSLRAAFAMTWFSLGVYSLYSAVNFFVIQNSQIFISFQVTTAAFILLAIILFIVYYLLLSRKKRLLKNISGTSKPIILTGTALVIVFLLILFDGFRVVSDMQTWKETPYNRLYINNNVPLEKNGKLITYSIFQNIPVERPARAATDPAGGFFTWLGYLQGSYQMQDHTNEILKARSIVEANNVYRQYMLMKWTPILVSPNFTNPQYTNITLPVSTFSNVIKQDRDQSPLCSTFTCDSAFSSKHLTQPNLQGRDQVVQTRYGINDISYKVKLKEPKLMVENEIYFPGWQADLIFPNKEMKVKASPVNDVFRAWLIPAGDYVMLAHFHFPDLIIYQSISIISLGVWIFIIVKYWRRLDDYKQLMDKNDLTLRT